MIKSSKQSVIESLKAMRDRLIRELWVKFRDMSDLVEADDFSEEDLKLWELVTLHSAVQSRLGNNLKESKA